MGGNAERRVDISQRSKKFELHYDERKKRADCYKNPTIFICMKELGMPSNEMLQSQIKVATAPADPGRRARVASVSGAGCRRPWILAPKERVMARL
jgi:hypothetical protein